MEITPQNLMVLNTGFSKVFQGAFDGAEATHDMIATTINSTSKSNTYGWLGKTTGFREWIGPRVLQSLKAHGYSITNKKFENTVTVEATDIEDDELGIYPPMFQQLGQDAKEHPDELVYGALQVGDQELCYDGQYFFDTDHPVGTEATGTTTVSNFTTGASPAWYVMDNRKVIKPIIYQKRKDYRFTALDNPKDPNVFHNDEFIYGADGRGNVGYGLWQLIHQSQQDLTAENLNAVISAMMSMKGDNAKPLRIRPTHLVVPPILREKARTLLNAEEINGTTNINRGALKLHEEPWLA